MGRGVGGAVVHDLRRHLVVDHPLGADGFLRRPPGQPGLGRERRRFCRPAEIGHAGDIEQITVFHPEYANLPVSRRQEIILDGFQHDGSRQALHFQADLLLPLAERKHAAGARHQELLLAGIRQGMGLREQVGLRGDGVRARRPVAGIVDHGPDLPLARRAFQRQTGILAGRDFELRVETGRRGDFQVAGIAAGPRAEHEDLHVADHLLVGLGLGRYLGGRCAESHRQGYFSLSGKGRDIGTGDRLGAGSGEQRRAGKPQRQDQVLVHFHSDAFKRFRCFRRCRPRCPRG